MIAEMLKARIDELGIKPNDVVLRYCDVLKARGEDAKPVNKRNMVYRVLSGETTPKVDTFQDIVKALGGEVKISWVSTQEVTLDQPN